MIIASDEDIAEVGVRQYESFTRRLRCNWGRLNKAALVHKLHTFPRFIEWFQSDALGPDGYPGRVNLTHVYQILFLP
jgi:hypothetical protein